MRTLEDNIILIQDKTPEYKNGFYVAEHLRKLLPHGKVVAVGPDVKNIKEGDKVILQGNEVLSFFEEGDKFYSVVKEYHIEAIDRGGDLELTNGNLIIERESSERITESGIYIAKNEEEERVAVIKNYDKSLNVLSNKVLLMRLTTKVLEYNDDKYDFVKLSDTLCFLDGDYNIIPNDDFVYVEQDNKEYKTKSGIVLNPTEADHLRPNVGKIKFIGKNVKDLNIGDRVFFSMYAGRKLQWKAHSKDYDFIVLKKHEIQAIVPEDSKVTGGYTEDYREVQENLGAYVDINKGDKK